VVKRALVAVVLAGSVAGLSTLGVAQASRRAVVPVHGSTPCKPSPPHLLGAGRAPLAPLRLDITGIAHHSQKVHDVETFARSLKLLDGKWHSTTEVRKIEVLEKGGGITRGKVALSTKNTVSYPATKTTAGGGGGTFTLKGLTDSLSGGFLGGTAGNDRFPVEAVGVGATWRVVTCDYVDNAAAKEIRTYTLRSVAHRIAVLTFRDVVSMDPTQRDLGTQKIGTETVHVKLDRLKGTASGTQRLPLAAVLRSTLTQVTKVEFTFHVVSKNVPATPLLVRLVDTRTDTPAG
jgi:hypothetical protein